MDVAEYLPKQEDMKNDFIRDGDYIADDGLWHCGVCGKPLQKKIDTRILKKVVWCICDCRVKEIEEERLRMEHKDEMRWIERAKAASMMDEKYRSADFEKYVVREENKKAYRVARKYVEDFQRMAENNIGIVFYGNVGTGKSFTAACIANSLLDKGVSVIMTSFVKILQDIRGIEDETRYIGALCNSSLLIIDDLGAERDTEYGLEKVYNVIDSRSRANRPMILTTNLSFDEMMKCADIRYRRIYDRIFENCHPVGISGSSFRIMKAARRQEELKKYFE